MCKFRPRCDEIPSGPKHLYNRNNHKSVDPCRRQRTLIGAQPRDGPLEETVPPKLLERSPKGQTPPSPGKGTAPPSPGSGPLRGRPSQAPGAVPLKGPHPPSPGSGPFEGTAPPKARGGPLGPFGLYKPDNLVYLRYTRLSRLGYLTNQVVQTGGGDDTPHGIFNNKSDLNQIGRRNTPQLLVPMLYIPCCKSSCRNVSSIAMLSQKAWA